jgi:hypothetical protein
VVLRAERVEIWVRWWRWVSVRKCVSYCLADSFLFGVVVVM